MKNQLLQRALNSLAHPISIGAAVILLLNAVIWQKFWPSWWTGKIGDSAWLIFVPFLVVIAVEICLPNRLTQSSAWGEWAIFSTGIMFSLVKAVSPVHTFAVGFIRQLGFTPKLVLDPSDLIALPALLIAWWIWKNSNSRTAHPMTRVSVLVLAALAVIADSPAAILHGEICLMEREGIIYGFSQAENPTSYFGHGPYKYWTSVYSSRDGGATWSRSEIATKEERDQIVECGQVSWPISVANANSSDSQLFFVESQGIYVSDDDGQTLHLEQQVSKIYSVVVDPSSGNLIVAAGTDGIYVRTKEGEWFEATQSSK